MNDEYDNVVVGDNVEYYDTRVKHYVKAKKKPKKLIKRLQLLEGNMKHKTSHAIAKVFFINFIIISIFLIVLIIILSPYVDNIRDAYEKHLLIIHLHLKKTLFIIFSQTCKY